MIRVFEMYRFIELWFFYYYHQLYCSIKCSKALFNAESSPVNKSPSFVRTRISGCTQKPTNSCQRRPVFSSCHQILLHFVCFNKFQNLYSAFKSTNLGNSLYSVVDVPISLAEKFLNLSVLKRFLPVTPKVSLFSLSLYRVSKSKK